MTWSVLTILEAGAVARGVIRTHGGFFAPYVVFCAFCIGYSAISGSLVSWGSAAAAGSGIPEIKTYLNGVHVPGKRVYLQRARVTHLAAYLSELAGLRCTVVELRLYLVPEWCYLNDDVSDGR